MLSWERKRFNAEVGSCNYVISITLKRNNFVRIAEYFLRHNHFEHFYKELGPWRSLGKNRDIHFEKIGGTKNFLEFKFH